MARYTDLKGKVFGRLTVLEYIGIKYDSANWKCGCRCGWYTEATIGDLNRTKRPKRSCGKCQADERYPSEWYTWIRMHQRCDNSNNKDYINYGARGIKICTSWRMDFYNFLEDMGLKEHSSLSLDRINNNGNYEKSNCRWADSYTQNNNKRNTLYTRIIHPREGVDTIPNP